MVCVLPVRNFSEAEGGSTVPLDYNASNPARRVIIAIPKLTLGDATPEDGRGVLIWNLGARTEGMG